jgi:hypothetical protein
MLEEKAIQEIPVISAELAEFQRKFLAEGLSAEDKVFIYQDPNEAARLCITAIKNRNRISDFLKHRQTIVTPYSDDEFIVQDKFVVDVTDEAAVQIEYIGKAFRDWFLDKIEKPLSPNFTLDLSVLLKPLIDRSIINGLSKNRASVTLRELYFLMKNEQLDKHDFHVFYIPDAQGILRAVDVCWRKRGWHLYGLSAKKARKRPAGCMIISRNLAA